MTRFIGFLASLILAANCSTTGEKEQTKAEPASEVKTAKPVAPAVTDSRTQYDLAAAIRVAERQGDEDQRATAFASLVEAWQGRRFQWRANYLRAFCPNETGCHVVPFDRADKDKDIVQGWSPHIKLSAEQWRHLSTTCANADQACPLTFEGKLTKFRLSTEELTRLTFDDVTLVAIGSDLHN